MSLNFNYNPESRHMYVDEAMRGTVTTDLEIADFGIATDYFTKMALFKQNNKLSWEKFALLAGISLEWWIDMNARYILYDAFYQPIRLKYGELIPSWQKLCEQEFPDAGNMLDILKHLSTTQQLAIVQTCTARP
jgi:hypothetical protein